MELATIKRMADDYDGKVSQVYPLVRERLNALYDDEPDYSSPLPFACEFLFFEDYYFRIIKHIKANQLDLKYKTVVDIGCQFGIQSVLFDEFRYIGINDHEMKFFTDDNINARYAVETFPNISTGLKKRIVISCMSLGFFNNEKEGITDEKIAEKLAEADVLYLVSTEEVQSLLEPKFKTKEVIDCRSRNLWYLCNV